MGRNCIITVFVCIGLLFIILCMKKKSNNDIVIQHNFLRNDDFNELVERLKSFVPVKDPRTRERLSITKIRI
jgi:hypothetical protein